MTVTNNDQIMTYTGRLVHLLAPKPEDISLEDIARALSRSQRYAGHAHKPCSIAEHCVLVSRLVAPQNALLGLLHDASEAFCQDITKPLKNQLHDYDVIEARWSLAIGQAFGLGDALVSLPADVHAADAVALQTERRDCFYPSRVSPKGPEPSRQYFCRGLEASAAYVHFVTRFRALT